MGWKVGEVSGGFLFTVPPLRGAGTGCLLTVLERGGEKGESSGGQTIRHETDSKSRRLRADKSESRHGWKRSETPLPEFGVTSSERRTKRGRKTTGQFQIREALAAASLQGQDGQQGGRTYKTPNQQPAA